MNIEGLGRQLYPQLDLWATARPILKKWVVENTGPLAVLRELKKNAPEWGRLLPQMPGLLHQVALNSAQKKPVASFETHTRPVVYAIFAAAFFLAGVLVSLLKTPPDATPLVEVIFFVVSIVLALKSSGKI